MRAFSIINITVGRREQIALTTSLAPIIEWRWWAWGPLRSFWAERAIADALSMIAYECGPPSHAPAEDRPPPQALACELAVVFGGRPDEWRSVRWRDAVFMMALKAYRDDPKRQTPRPVWGAHARDRFTAGAPATFRRVA